MHTWQRSTRDTDPASNTSADTTADAGPNASADTTPDTCSNASADATTEIGPNASADTTPDTGSNTGTDDGTDRFVRQLQRRHVVRLLWLHQEEGWVQVNCGIQVQGEVLRRVQRHLLNALLGEHHIPLRVRRQLLVLGSTCWILSATVMRAACIYSRGQRSEPRVHMPGGSSHTSPVGPPHSTRRDA